MADQQLTDAGIVGGTIAVATAIWGAIKWLLVRSDRKKQADKEREDTLIAKLEQRVKALENEHEDLKRAVDHWRVAFKVVADELAMLKPNSASLALARQMLSQAFPADPFIPPDMADLVRHMGEDTPANQDRITKK